MFFYFANIRSLFISILQENLGYIPSNQENTLRRTQSKSSQHQGYYWVLCFYFSVDQAPRAIPELVLEWVSRYGIDTYKEHHWWRKSSSDPVTSRTDDLYLHFAHRECDWRYIEQKDITEIVADLYILWIIWKIHVSDFVYLSSL